MRVSRKLDLCNRHGQRSVGRSRSVRVSRKLGRKTRTDVTDVDSRGGSVSGRSRTGRGRGIGALGRRHDSQGAMRERHGRGLLTRTRALVMQNIVGRFARTQS